MFLSKKAKLEIAIEYIKKMAMDEAENASINFSSGVQTKQDAKEADKESTSLYYALEILERELTYQQRPVRL